MAREKLEKERKPKKQRWYHHVWNAYQMTRQTDPSVTWWVLGAFLLVVALAVVVGFATGYLAYFVIMSLPFGFLAGMFVLTRKAEKAAYTRIKGKPGAVHSALGTVRRNWTFEEEPIAFSAKNQDLVFRGVGPAGVVLVSEGPTHRVSRMLRDETKRIARVLPNVPVVPIQMGDGEDQVPLPKIAKTVSKLKAEKGKKLTKNEIAEINKRLKALGSKKLPIPKGVDPARMRPDRKGMRGR